MTRHTETVPMTERIIETPSALIPGQIIRTTMPICPRCKADVPNADHGKDVRCSECKLHITVWGAAAIIHD